mgnify:CR=1 FL=1
MGESNIEDKLNELVREFEDTPAPDNQRLANLAKQAQKTSQQPEKSTTSLQESLDYLRICIKYQAFDLEATRRENEELRKLLENQKNYP